MVRPRMTYHHNRRLKAHLDPETTISPAQYLVAVFVADEIRANTSEFSISLNRLAKEARLSYATAQRSITALVKANILEIIRPHTRYTAPIYRLAVSCPDLCGDLRDHNTQQELAWIEALQKPQHTFKNSSDVAKSDISIGVSATYINKRDEEDITILQDFVEGSLELAILLDLLKQPKTAIEEEILVSATKHPKTMSQTLLGLLPKSIEGEKRIRAYLAKVLSDSPERLKLNIELLLAQQSSSHLIATNSEAKTAKKGIDLPDYKVAITKERFNSWITLVSGVKSEFNWLSSFWSDVETKSPYYFDALHFGFIDTYAQSYLAETFAHNWLKQGLIQLSDFYKPDHFGKFVFTHTKEFEQAKTKGWSTWQAENLLERVLENITQQDIDNSLNPDEKKKLAHSKQLEQEWIEAHPQLRAYEYYGSDEYRSNTKLGLVFSIDKRDVAERMLIGLNDIFLPAEQYLYSLQKFVDALPQEPPKVDFMDYMKNTFTLQDDLDILLKLIPERPEGHKKHVRKFATAYLDLLKTNTFSDIKSMLYKATGLDYYEPNLKQLQGDTYSLAPDNYLLKVVEDNKEPAWITHAKASSD